MPVRAQAISQINIFTAMVANLAKDYFETYTTNWLVIKRIHTFAETTVIILL
jgi:hypothetical protein